MTTEEDCMAAGYPPAPVAMDTRDPLLRLRALNAAIDAYWNADPRNREPEIKRLCEEQQLSFMALSAASPASPAPVAVDEGDRARIVAELQTLLDRWDAKESGIDLLIYRVLQPESGGSYPGLRTLLAASPSVGGDEG